MIAWSVLSILLCTIPGIVGLVHSCQISGSRSAEEEAQHLSNAKTWNTIATVLGGIWLLIAIFSVR